MNKIIILLLICLFLSGCSVEYNVHIDSGIVYEDTLFTVIDNIENDNTIDNITANNQSAFFNLYTGRDEFYEVKKINSGEGLLGIKYYYEFNYNNFVNSTLFSECFSERMFSFNNNEVVLNTGNGLNCMYKDGYKNFDELVINVSSPYKLIETNADSVENDIYTWKITEENFSSKSLLLKLDATILNEDVRQDNFNEIVKYIAIGLAGLFLIFIVVFYIKYKRTI